MRLPFRPENFAVLFALALAWNGLFVLASIAYRRRKGKRFFRPAFDDARFLETWRSGRSLRNVFSRLGGANNCLWVAVAADGSLHVGPHFPLTLMFMPELYSLEYAVPAAAIRSTERVDSFFRRKRLRITFAHPAGHEESFELHLKDPDAFLRALDPARKPP